MTIASLIVNVAANTVQLQKDVGQINGQLGLVSKSAEKVAASSDNIVKQFGRVQKVIQGLLALKIVQWLSSLVLGALAYADALGKMRVTLDIGYQGLQRLENIAAGSDTTVQALTSSILDMQRRLATGDESALGALEKLGFGLEEFMALKGDEQFMAIAKEIGKMQDSVEQNEAAYRLFGRSYKEISSAIKSDVDRLADSVMTLTDEQIENVAKAEDKWVALKLTMSRIGLWAASFAVDFDKATFALRDQTFHVDKLSAAYDWLRGRMTLPKVTLGAADNPDNPAAGVAGIFGNTSLPKVGLPGEAALKTIYRELNDTLQVTQDRFKVMAEKTAADTVEKAKNLAAVHDLTVGTTQLTDSIAVWQFQLEDTGREMVDVRLKVLDLERSATVGIGNIGEAVEDMGAKVKRFDGFSLGKDLSETIIGALQGGGSAIASVAAKIGQQLASSISKGFSKSFAGGVAGGALSAGLTFGLSAIASYLMSPTTGSANKNASRLLQQLIDLAGGMEALRRQAARAGVELASVFDGDLPLDYIRRVEELSEALTFQDQAMQTLTETAEKYGFTIEELGPKFAAQQLDKQAQELFQDWEVLNAAGIDTTHITERMSGAINAYFQAAMQTNTEIPRAMQPLLQNMVKLGLLTDQNGVVISDLEDAGVRFAETLSEGFDRIIDSVRELTDAIKRGLTPAIHNIPAISVGLNIEAPEGKTGKKFIHHGGVIMHDGGPVGRMLQFAPRAHSGLAIGEVPIIAQRGEVMFSRANVAAMGGVGATESFRRGLGSGRGSVVNISTARLEAQMEALRKEQAAMREAFLGQQRQLPALTAIAARDAMQQQARRR